MQIIDIPLKPSRQFKSYLALVALGSLGISFTLPIPIVGRLLLALGALIYTHSLWQQYGTLRAKLSIRAIQVIGENHWRLTLTEGVLDGKLLANSTVTRRVCLLRFQVPGKRWPLSCLVLNDSVNQPLYKQLLLQLRCCTV